jgi:hypothetical protein
MEFDEFEVLLHDAQAKYAGGRVPEGLRLFDSLRASDQDLDHVESGLAVSLPKKYREFMKRHGGGQFLFIDLLPAISKEGRRKDLLIVNSDASLRGKFVAVAPVGTGDWWGFSVADGKCKESVDFLFHEDGLIEEGRNDFLEFLSKQALRVGS